jgi:hypothetical protein
MIQVSDRMRSGLVLASLLSTALVCVFCWPSASHAQAKFSPPRWEYKLVEWTDDMVLANPLAERLNPLGKDGWEAVSYAPKHPVLLKRRLAD